MNPYECIFPVESERFLLRGVKMEDADALLTCYGDARASLLFPDDNCYCGFYSKNADQVRRMIYYWLDEYGKGVYVRYAIIDKRESAAIGTIELFNRGRHGTHENVGILRLDVASAYETRADIAELILLVHDRLMDDFGLEALLTPAPQVAEARRAALSELGFTGADELVPWTDWFFAARKDVQSARVERYWRAFLRDTGRAADVRYIACDHFEVTEKGANALLELVLSGKKRATASSGLAYLIDGEKVPAPGDLSIVTDFFGVPKCVIETTRVTTLPFRDMTYEICAREGEDDCLESWQRNHIAFFTADGRETGYEFSWDMPVIFEDFQLAYAGAPREADAPGAFPMLDQANRTLTRAMDAVRAFAARASEIFDGALAAAYLCGSAPFGDFHAGISDLDFFFVSERPLSQADFDAFHALYLEYRALSDGFFSALEGEIACADALLSREGKTVYWGTRGDRFADRYTLSGFSMRGLQKRGMLLTGRDLRDRMPGVSSDEMRAQAAYMCETVRAHAAQATPRATYADWLFLLAQTLYYLETGDVACKTRAAEWLRARAKNEETRTALTRALRVRTGTEAYTLEMGQTFTAPILRLADEIDKRLCSKTD